MAGLTGEDTGYIAEGFTNMGALAVNGVLPDLLVVHGTPHLQDRYPPSHLPIHLHVAEQDDRISDSGNMRLPYRGSLNQAGSCGRVFRETFSTY